MRKQNSQTAEMDRSYLVQRLKKPHSNRLVGALAFGGGLRNGGLSDIAMTALGGLFSFDYMGAAEFEWGAVPDALGALAKDADSLVAFTLDVSLADVPANWRDKSKTVLTGTATVYCLSRAQHEAEVRERIAAWSREEYPRLKEATRLTSALRPFNEWDGEVAGWFELDNGFLFFTDADMWRGTCALFGVKTAERAA